MGTQQILLIVLSVIIVGVAIAVGITMFSNQAYNSNQQAVSGELQNYASQVIQYWKTPTSQGGAGQSTTGVSASTIATFIGFDPTALTLTTDNGTFKVAYTAAADEVTLYGLGTEDKGGNKPLVTTTVTLSTSAIAASV